MSSRGSYYVGSCLISSRGKGGGCRPPGASAPPPRNSPKANFVEEGMGNGGEGRVDAARAYGSSSSRHRNTHNNERRSPSTSTLGYECSRSDGGWAGGVPLISVALARGANIPPCSRLAFRGAPLILSSRGKVEGGGRGGRPPPRTVDVPGVRRRACGGRLAPEKETPTHTVAYQGSDNVSVASDEGSSSVNSESSLPRIIKPRKRRKKERRPAKAKEEAAPAPPPEPPAAKASIPPGAVVGERTQEPTVGKIGLDAVNLEETDDPPASLCHCRLCDPSGFIWGVDRSCYSPFLTPTPPPTYSVYRPSPVRPASDSPAESTVVAEAEWTAGGVLQRWSAVGSVGKAAPLPVETEEVEDRKWRVAGRNLEVSTEIITSPNGHRDLEIKFYSTLSSALKNEDDESGSRRCSWSAYPFHLTAAAEE